MDMKVTPTDLSLATDEAPGAIVIFLRKAGQTIRRHKLFFALVVVPVLLSIAYYGPIASDQYLSQASFLVKSPGQQGAQTSTLANLIQTTGLSRGQEETNAVLDYVRSRNALEDLQKRIDVRAMFMSAGADRLARYPSPLVQDRFENLYDYYKKKVEVYLDTETGLAVMRVKAFSSSDAHTIASALLSLSEDLVNQLNERAHKQGIIEAERRVLEAEDRVRKASGALALFRNKQSLLDPKLQATGILEIVTKLSAQKADVQSRLDRMTRAAPDSPNVEVLRSQVAALTREIDSQTLRMAGGEAAISSKLGDYEYLALEQTFAARMLESANASLELARVDADKQQFYLQRVVEPNAPDLARYPRRLASIFVVFGVALCLFFIGWMLLAGIIEHSPEH
jgi:capsular polysaccharide transport system permease protein